MGGRQDREHWSLLGRAGLLQRRRAERLRVAERMKAERLKQGEDPAPDGAFEPAIGADWEQGPMRRGGALTPGFIHAIIGARRMRERYFAGQELGEAEWDILLELLAARLQGRPVSVMGACRAASAPQTTALRAAGALVEKGLAERVRDPSDRRRVFLTLTDEAAAAMTAYLAAARELSEVLL